MAETITITVDGRELQVPAGSQLIEALRSAGIDTPAFCYHPDLPVAGNCRICLVEVEGPRGWALAISCHMKTAPGMKVRTPASSPAVAKARRGVMEFLLVNHPLDCPICDKAGECTLQEHSMTQGSSQSRLDDAVGKAYKGGVDLRFTDRNGESRGGKRIDLGPTVVLDQERCIVCGRCVRFMDEVAKTPQLAIAGRGDHAYITTFPGEKLDHPYDLNVTDICPVGALTGKHFRFQQRVWMLKTVESIDPSDALGANLTIEYNQGRVFRLMPRRNPAVNRSWLANASRLLYRRIHADRLADGRIAGQDVPLEQALEAGIAAVAGAKRIALVASGHLTLEDNASLLALRERLGARAELFGGSWLPVGSPDGIALSGDPVANRAGLRLLDVPDNLDELARRAGDFDLLISAGHDLWGADAAKAASLQAIPQRLALSSWTDATVAKATIAVGLRCWAEVRGTMVNCQGRAQRLNPAPVWPNPALEPAWAVLARLDGGKWIDADAWAAVERRIPALAGKGREAIGPMGLMLEGT